GEQIHQLTEEKNKLTKELEKQKVQLDGLRGDVKRERDEAVRFWAYQFGPEDVRPDSAVGGLRSAFQDGEQQAYGKIRNILPAAETAKVARKVGEEVVAKVQAERARLEGRIGQARWHSFTQTAARVSLCLGFVYLGFLPLRRVRKRLRKQREREAEE